MVTESWVSQLESIHGCSAGHKILNNRCGSALVRLATSDMLDHARRSDQTRRNFAAKDLVNASMLREMSTELREVGRAATMQDSTPGARAADGD